VQDIPVKNNYLTTLQLAAHGSLGDVSTKFCHIEAPIWPQENTAKRKAQFSPCPCSEHCCKAATIYSFWGQSIGRAEDIFRDDSYDAEHKLSSLVEAFQTAFVTLMTTMMMPDA
jgi:hypothetical protein